MPASGVLKIGAACPGEGVVCFSFLIEILNIYLIRSFKDI